MAGTAAQQAQHAAACDSIQREVIRALQLVAKQQGQDMDPYPYPALEQESCGLEQLKVDVSWAWAALARARAAWLEVAVPLYCE